MDGKTPVFGGGERHNIKESQLLAYLERWYDAQTLQTVLLPFVQGKTPVSLRAIDWLVVNYAKQNNIVTLGSDGRAVNVYNSYQEKLRYWRRRLFDPFRRRERLDVRIDGQTHSTTLGQANFAIWAHHTGVLKYARAHAAQVELDMNLVTRQVRSLRKARRRDGQRMKRSKGLTEAATRVCAVYPIQETLFSTT